MRRLFTDNQVSDIVSSIDVGELFETRELKIDEKTEVKIYFGNVGFDAHCYRWEDEEYVEVSSVLVWGTGEPEEDLLYGVGLVLQRAEMPA